VHRAEQEGLVLRVLAGVDARGQLVRQRDRLGDLHELALSAQDFEEPPEVPFDHDQSSTRATGSPRARSAALIRRRIRWANSTTSTTPHAARSQAEIGRSKNMAALPRESTSDCLNEVSRSGPRIRASARGASSNPAFRARY